MSCNFAFNYSRGYARMLRFPLTLTGLFLILCGLVACGEDQPVAPEPVTRPVKLFRVEGGSGDVVRTFPGRVDASQRAELAFRVSGRLQEILVKEGDLVQEGQVLARLDPTDYQIALEDREATYDNASRNFERAKELVVDGNISRIDFDRMEADFRSAAAALSQARRDLEYTVLVSPFTGRIAERKVENFEEISARQTIFSLQNINKLDVIIDIPESIVRSVRGSARDDDPMGSGAASAERAEVRAWAQFEGRPDQRFPLAPKEIATRADPQTRTFRATLTMEAPTSFNVLPGMTASVVLDISHLVNDEGARWVPVRAVQADSALSPRVWVLDPETMTVAPRDVVIGRMSGNMIEIISGLEGGEEIVAVGAPYLAEGMRVTRMESTEQAVPREDEPA
jgi:RND family efflux transporter MFP subunit